MLFKVFRTNQGFTILFLFVLSIVTWGLVVLDKTFEPGVHGIYNYSLFYLFPSLRSIDNNLFLSTALNLLLILISGFYLTRLTIRYQLLPNRNLLPMLTFFIISLPYFTKYTGFSFELLTLPVLLYVIDQLFQSAENKRLAYSYFNCSIILSLASLLNQFLLFYFIFVLFLFFRLRGIYWRELVFILFGALLPYFILFSSMYLLDADISAFLKNFSLVWQFKTDIYSNSSMWYLISFLIVLFLVASWKTMNQYVKMKILTRKYSVAFLLFFIISVVMVLVIPFINRDSLFFIGAPLSFLFAYYFTTCKINIVSQALFLFYLLINFSVFAISMI